MLQVMIEAGQGEEATVSLEVFEKADPLLLALTVVYLTADMNLLTELEEARRGSGRLKLGDSLKAQVLAKAAGLLNRRRSHSRPAANLPADVMNRLVALAVGFSPEAHYVSMLLDQAGFSTGKLAPKLDVPREQAADFQVVVIGAGMSGICAGIDLKHAGIAFTILEKTNSVGGTWQQNAYPGCGVDTPSYFYSYSFAQNAEWSRYFVKRDEILAYFERCVSDFGLTEHIRLETAVTAAIFDEKRQKWRVTVSEPGGTQREIWCNAIITAVGQLNIPAIPKIPGLDKFGGKVVHTAEWSDQHDAAGRRVGLIGVGASAMQVGPAIANSVTRLKVFQREPHWILPNNSYHADVPVTEQRLHQQWPDYLRWKRLQMIWTYGDAVYGALKLDPQWATPDVSLNETSERYRQNMLAHIGREVGDDPDLLAKVTPSYPPYGKRVLLDNHWYRMLKRDNVNLVTSDIEAIEPGAIRTRDGARHAVDMIVLATGFQASRMLWPIDFQGRGGVRLREIWNDDNPRAYLGITMPGFPNLFVMYGPNTNLGYGGSAIFNSECQSRYITACLQALRANQWATLECRQDVHDEYNTTVDNMHANMVWARNNVSNWYRNQGGRVTTNTPWSMADYWSMTQIPEFNDYVVRGQDCHEIAPNTSA